MSSLIVGFGDLNSLAIEGRGFINYGILGDLNSLAIEGRGFTYNAISSFKLS